jgi:hypothetical protein
MLLLWQPSAIVTAAVLDTLIVALRKIVWRDVIIGGYVLVLLDVLIVAPRAIVVDVIILVFLVGLRLQLFMILLFRYSSFSAVSRIRA